MKPTNLDYEALIVGAGFGGMGAAIQLNQMGMDKILMLDREKDLGGTWQINRYPGLQCDVPSVSYSYSFEPNPYWSQRYASGPEIKAYANHVADKYRLRRFMRFNTSVEKAAYDEGGEFWTIYPSEGKPITARILVLATGYLSQPKKPDIAGVDSFAGKMIHTADWDHDYDFTGTRAAMIGTGATAVQVLPIIAEKVDSIAVYQRTPIWVFPKNNPEIPPRIQKIYSRFPATQAAVRRLSDKAMEMMMVTAVLHGKKFPFLARGAEKVCRNHLENQVPDPELRRKLTPDYSFGCKRPTFANDYFPTFNKSNVELVTDPIDHIEADAIVTKDGTRREIDTLVLATGFNLWQKGNFPAFDVIGRKGTELGDWWYRNRYQSYEGITVPGFPNLFNLHSPYSYSGFCYFNTIEIHMKHMERVIGEMKRRGAKGFEVTREAEQRFMEEMWANADKSVFATTNCATANSYYFNPHGEVALLRLTSEREGMANAKRFPIDSYAFE